jgi:hypothetical protein
MPKLIVDVVLDDVEVDIIKPIDGFVRIDFGGYHKFKTETIKKSKAHRYKKEAKFSFSTGSPDKRLKNSKIQIDLQCPGLIGKTTIGSADLLLQTCMLGPEHHDLMLWNGAEEIGRVRFTARLTARVDVRNFNTVSFDCHSHYNPSSLTLLI